MSFLTLPSGDTRPSDSFRVSQFGVTSALITVVTWSSLFAHSDKSVVFAYFFVFGLSSIGLCFFLSTFFSRARTAASVGALTFLGAFFPYYTLVDPQAPG
jgi:ATP-binding cassette subfamily A (ABC1) protein 3